MREGHMNIPVVRERARGCGFRKEGGIYLRTDGIGRPCGKLPIPLTLCPTCHAGIKFSRGWTWVDADALTKSVECQAKGDYCSVCPLGQRKLGRAGLIWIGEQFYPTPADWTREANEMGVSRRIKTIPREFGLGKTWVLVAHRKAVYEPEPGAKNNCYQPGIFHAFLPSRLEYVVKGTETEEEIEALRKRGLTPVRVEREG